MLTQLMDVDFSWYTEKRRVKCLKNSSILRSSKNLIDSPQKTIDQVNHSFPPEKVYCVVAHPVGRNNAAVGKFLVQFLRLEAKMTELWKKENELLKSMVFAEQSTQRLN